jgi:hypothetical protein
MKTQKLTLTQLSEKLGKSRQYLNKELNKGNNFAGLVIKVEKIETGSRFFKIIHIQK